MLLQLEARAKEELLIVHDEVHGFGAPQCVKDLQGLQQSVRFRLGLSATPEREYDQAGSKFVEQEIGPVVYRFGLKEAIERGILVEFDYVPLDYALTAGDKKRWPVFIARRPRGRRKESR